MTTKLLPSRNVLLGFLHIALLLFFATHLHSCTDEHTNNPTPDGEEKTITFSVKVPGGFTPATYTLTPSEENKVETVDVLLFESGGNNDFVSGPHYGAISGSNVTIRIPENTATYDMVILANCRSDLNADFSGKTKSDVLSDLKRTITPGDGGATSVGGTDAGWLTTGTDKTIPMWAETTVEVNASTATINNGNNQISLVRMLSRITVKATAVNALAAGKGNFTLTEIYLCNYNDAGRIAPTATNWSNGTATAPTEIGTKQTGSGTAIKYTVAGNTSLYDIYAFETATKSESAYDAESPCVVVGGTFENDQDHTYYYRIDFVNGNTAPPTYLSLLRNHSYDITISEITGLGATDFPTALSQQSANIVASVMRWNDNTIGTIVVGSKVLGVSQGTFKFDAAARDASNIDNTLIIVTENISAAPTLIVTDAWLSTVQQGDAVVSDTKTTYTYKLLCNKNDTGISRTGTITIAVDGLEYEVGMEQSNINTNISIQSGGADVSTLLFAAALGEVPFQKSVTLTWEPSNAKVLLENSAISNPNFVITESSRNAGTITYNITPNNPIDDKTNVVESDIDFVLLLDDGTTINKTLSLYQCVPYIDITSTIGRYYLLNGSNVSVPITFNTNVPWEVKSVTETDAAGDPVSLLMAANKTSIETANGSFTDPGSVTLSSVTDTNIGGFVKVIIGTQDNLGVEDITVTVPFAGTLTSSTAAADVKWAGSNIYYDSETGKLTFDATEATETVTENERKQGLYFKWGSLYGISPVGSSFSVTDTKIYTPSSRESTASAEGFTDWASIPYIANGDLSVDVTTDNFLYYRTDDQNTPANAKFGDICRWITLMGWAPGKDDGHRWRMPTNDEFGMAYSGTDNAGNDIKLPIAGAGWSRTVSNSSTYGTGTLTDVTGRKYTTTGNTGLTFFPAAGLRDAGGTMDNVGLYALYWSSSPSSGFSYYLGFGNAYVYMNDGSRLRGYNVRCVRE